MKYTSEDLHIFTLQPIRKNYEAWLKVRNAVWSDEPISVAQLAYEDTVWPSNYFAQRLMIEVDNTVVAIADLRENHFQYQPGKYDIDILVDPDYQNRGIGSIVYKHVAQFLSTLDPVATSYVCGTREDSPQAVAFLKNRGFEVTMRWARSRLFLNTFDSDRFEDALHRVERQGIQIRSIREIASSDPAWKHKWYEMDRIAGEDAPSPDPMSGESFETFVQNVMEPPRFLDGGTFIALDAEGQWLASTELANSGNGKHLITPFTCVHPDHRRHGIATALKVRAIQFAQAYGAETITTGNEVKNPMYQINLALGFEPLPNGLTMKKILL